MNFLDLSGRLAVVTGGGQGIGFAVATRVASAQCAVVIVDIDEKNAQEAVERLKADERNLFRRILLSLPRVLAQ